ncbi:vWA domain-containing protein [Polluticaenibacter yanchengensis]|uniref:von Willebrand factor type A domain-containing protein n=1 Tax=Polluticaenibacter yanchengensis TaxID=3014562 RepID=A0ABT4UGE5_9BACT|nr:von Willebrand factor type A domain-containing protein [Chitinophagaceae bacterium LY-5]
MKKCFLLGTLFCFGIITKSFSQVFITGSVINEKNEPVSFVKLKVKSNQRIFDSGSKGIFGISVPSKNETLICYTKGYDTLEFLLKAGVENKIQLKYDKLKLEELYLQRQMSHVTTNYYPANPPVQNNNLIANPIVETSRYAQTKLALTSSYSNFYYLLNTIAKKQNISPAAVKTHELINYFPLDLTSVPSEEQLLSMENMVVKAPWDSTKLLLVGNVKSTILKMEKVPPANIVLLLDNSASMDLPNRLPLMKYSMKRLVQHLRNIDRVSIITYGGVAQVYLPPIAGNETDSILKAIDLINTVGSTPGSNGIVMAYDLAITNKIKDGNNNIVLATDGDFNVGVTEEETLIKLIDSYKNTNIKFNCVGVGMGDNRDSKIEQLAKVGNGNFAYLDYEHDAERFMIKALTQNFYEVASNVNFKIDFNPATVKNYRILGFKNRPEAVEYNPNKIDPVEIGTNFSGNFIFELQPNSTSADFGTMHLEYTAPKQPEIRRAARNISNKILSVNEAPPDVQQVIATAYLGLILEKDNAVKSHELSDVKKLLNSFPVGNSHVAELLKVINGIENINTPEIEPTKKRRK